MDQWNWENGTSAFPALSPLMLASWAGRYGDFRRFDPTIEVGEPHSHKKICQNENGCTTAVYLSKIRCNKEAWDRIYIYICSWDFVTRLPRGRYAPAMKQTCKNHPCRMMSPP